MGIGPEFLEVWYSVSKITFTTSWQCHHVDLTQALTNAVLPCSHPAALPELAEVWGRMSSSWWLLLWQMTRLKGIISRQSSLFFPPIPALLDRKEEFSPLLQEGKNALPKALTNCQVLLDQSCSIVLLCLMYCILGWFFEGKVNNVSA